MGKTWAGQLLQSIRNIGKFDFNCECVCKFSTFVGVVMLFSFNLNDSKKLF